MPFQALLFDLDGTLIDSEPSHKTAEILAFRELGIELDEAILNPFMGTTLPALLEGIGSQYGKQIGVSEFLEIEQPILARLIGSDIAIFEDARTFIEARIEVPRALVTSSMKWYLDAVMERFPEIMAWFPIRICQADVLNGKPDPEGYCQAIRRISQVPQHCLILEDSANGVKAARAAGCRVVGIDRHGLGNLGEADWVVPGLHEPYLSHVGIVD